MPIHLARAPVAAGRRRRRWPRVQRGRLAPVVLHRALLGRGRAAGEVRHAGGGRGQRAVGLGRRVAGLAPGRVDLLAQMRRHGVGGRHDDGGCVVRLVVVVDDGCVSRESGSNGLLGKGLVV